MAVQKMQTVVSKAILLRDAFTEDAVTKGIWIRTRQGKTPLGKPEGYWLFLNMGTEPFEAEVRSPVYQPLLLSLKPDGGREVEEFQLYPSRAYPLQEGRTSVLGIAQKETKLWFHLAEGTEEGKLLLDYQKGKPEISVFMENRRAKKSRGWYIWDKEKKKGEYFLVRREPEETERLTLSTPLRESYRKKDALLFPAWQCPSDEKGEFFLLLPKLDQGKYRLCCAYQAAGKTHRAETEISGGSQNIWQIGKER